MQGPGTQQASSGVASLSHPLWLLGSWPQNPQDTSEFLFVPQAQRMTRMTCAEELTHSHVQQSKDVKGLEREGHRRQERCPSPVGFCLVSSQRHGRIRACADNMHR